MILLDLDGVIAEFMYAACQVHGKPHDWKSWDFFKEWGMTREEFWRPINALGDDFYAYYVKPTPWAEELIAKVYEADKNVVICTDSSANMPGIRGKHNWILSMFGPEMRVSYTREKYLLAAPGRLLIDDSEVNCERFATFGGAALLFPRPWNAGYHTDPHASFLTAIAKLADWKKFGKVTTITDQDRLEAIEV
jgi:hypothetical protein